MVSFSCGSHIFSYGSEMYSFRICEAISVVDSLCVDILLFCFEWFRKDRRFCLWSRRPSIADKFVGWSSIRICEARAIVGSFCVDIFLFCVDWFQKDRRFCLWSHRTSIADKFGAWFGQLASISVNSGYILGNLKLFVFLRRQFLKNSTTWRELRG